MYCHYCGKFAVGKCVSCGHRFCGTHKGWLLGLHVCRSCRPAVVTGLFVAGLLVGGAVWLTGR